MGALAEADRPPCRSCGEKSLPGADAIAKLAESMPLDRSEACPEAAYRERLASCASCPDLIGGLVCAHCGCYAPFRARHALKRCPHPGGDRWPA